MGPARFLLIKGNCYIATLPVGSYVSPPSLAETAFLLGRNGPQQHCIISRVRRVLGRYWLAMRRNGAISSRLERYRSISKHPGTQEEADVSDSPTRETSSARTDLLTTLSELDGYDQLL